MKTFLSVALLFISQALVSASDAASITLGGDPVMECDATLKGEIVSGDAKVLENFIKNQNWTTDRNGLPHIDKTKKLCLDSPGGNYLEGVKIGEVISYKGISTAVGSERVCESACGLAFMYGTALGIEGLHAPARRLHPKGKLGFHAPSILINSGTYNESAVNEAYKVAISSIKAFSDSRKNLEIDFPEDLFLEMLGTPPDQMRYVTTVQDAALWGIEVFPVGDPVGTRDKIASYACINAYDNVQGFRTNERQSLPSGGAGFIRNVSHEEGFIHVETEPWFFAEGTYTCTLSAKKERLNLATKKVNWEADVANFGGVNYSKIYRSFFFDPSLPIVSLPTQGDISDHKIFQFLAGEISLPQKATVRADPQKSLSGVKQLNAGTSFTFPESHRLRANEKDEALLNLSRNERREVQRRLTLLGFDTKGVDGSFGPNSRSAIQAWQQQRSFPVSGYLNRAQKVLLFSDSQSLYDKWLADEAKKPKKSKKRRVKVCQRGPLGLLINCRIEWR
ncbi:peptidoglycan-binding protein [Antarctobacter jejuensis]|uniref:peptidoglycan-binding protein n=1 Tax=Antarctobacter jejuensis TaxID=1439938 RepID=UPI003FD40907